MFTRDELQTELLPILETLFNMDEGVWFREPVDPEKEKIPDYFDVIKNPMDLGTIKTRLNEGGHYSNPWNVSFYRFKSFGYILDVRVCSYPLGLFCLDLDV